MNILVCVKGVSSKLVQSDESIVLPKLVLNPYDTYSMIKAVEIKRRVPESRITCLCMGPKTAKEVLVRCLARGADEAVLLTDATFAGADTYATALTLARAAELLRYDLIICGKRSIDGETGQIAGGLAARLGLCCFTEVECLEMKSELLIVTYAEGAMLRTVKVPFPLVVSFADFCIHNTVSLLALKKAKKKEISILGARDLDIMPQECGSLGSKTVVHKTSANLRASQKNTEIIHEKIEEFLFAQIKKYQ